MSLVDLTSAQQAALSKAVSEDAYKEASKSLKPGEYLTDLAVRVVGKIKVSEPFVQSFALSFPWQKLALKLATRVPRHVLNAVMTEIRAEEPLEELKNHVNAMWADINKGSEKEAHKITGSVSVEKILR